ncbi:ArsR/SmtB family transcription factor [Desulfurobacterium indicum]|uniref:HTH arsR-type domain-containing protein n=1 Tax=Desulfurobacterium indicum TaxID=1914305 RepID=A0A1R1MJJ5_9BACT|nr:metalloregulator ArsR/SmtB family transcription factor [Desulfurobacterium indicum]OMH39926.1 hypothetical protein BLW93_07830 [Desulfurobacterium indicum]
MEIREKDIKNLSYLFKALSHPDRIKILLFLLGNNEKHNLKQLANKLKMKQAMLSIHLKELALAGLVLRERRGNNVIYFADEEKKEWIKEILIPALEFIKEEW